jgi:hypothetical protein
LAGKKARLKIEVVSVLRISKWKREKKAKARHFEMRALL